MGNQRIITHNAVRDSTRQMCKAAGLTTRIEDMQTLKQNDIDTKSRVDITCDNFLPGVPMGIDNSIADPRQTGLTVKPIPGKAAKKREYSKIKKYCTTRDAFILYHLLSNRMGAGVTELESSLSN